MIRVLALSKYDRLAASPRHRFLQFTPGLAKLGIELELAPLFDDTYLSGKFSRGRSRPADVSRAVARRLRDLVRVTRWDLAIIHCELIPYSPPWLEALLARVGVPYVYDYDDAIFHMYDEHPRPLVRRLLGDKVAGIIRHARAVTAGSEYLAAYARRFNDRVELMPTTIDLDRYRVRSVRPEGVPFTIGWIGSPSTSPYLEALAPLFQRLGAEAPLKIIAVGGRPFEVPGVDVQVRAWSEAREVDDLLECDVGVMPLPDTPWTRGKCAFKLIQYMACGLPSVGSAVGANHEVLTPDVGYLEADDEGWLTSLRALRDDPSLRARLGEAGLARVKAHYSLQSQVDNLARILSEAARR